MIRFLRKIRQKLLSGNEFSTYLIYAIGEIVLVVIGILIALSIDNWNEQKKQNKYERKMLNEIHSSLQGDYERCQNALSHLNAHYNFNDSILRFINTELPDWNTVENVFFNTTGNVEIEYQTSAYESLKSKGLDILSDDSLRIDLSNLYDFEYPNIQAEFSNYNIHLRNTWRPFMLDNFQTKVGNDPTQISRYPIDWEKLISDSKMENIIILNRWLANNAANNLQYVMNELEIIMALIENYLGR